MNSYFKIVSWIVPALMFGAFLISATSNAGGTHEAVINSVHVKAGQEFYVTGRWFLASEAGWDAHGTFSGDPGGHYSFDVEDSGKINWYDSPSFIAPLEPGIYTIDLFQYVYDPATNSYPDVFKATGTVTVRP